MKNIKKFKLPSHKDTRGVLTVIELENYVDWPIKRIYYLTDVTMPRGGHAVRGEKKIYVCQKGSVKAKFHDGKKWTTFKMKGPDDAILVEQNCFRIFEDFSKDTVLIAISSVNYNPTNYIYDFDEFINECN